eukprot:CAMPEP_0178959100 /NCGR_PEP_ID=MMETSP0789-20121207/12063_1 /TAXON_ID=3005 /ORGANISM="Rhizosolenia setigera, Strain CCMP 1694" /LENGTH=370 /DNA_ID=CAMNT_0020641985 /DNA_START=78 /DNA_END=1190 /DNA_ORIENTATION=+
MKYNFSAAPLELEVMKNTSGENTNSSNSVKSHIHEHDAHDDEKNRNNNSNNVVVAREAQDLPPTEKWSQYPILACVNNSACPDLHLSNNSNNPTSSSSSSSHFLEDSDKCIPIGVPIPFESDLFQGEILIRVKNATQQAVDKEEGGHNININKNNSEYFEGRRRRFQMIVQGKFKEDGIRVSDVLGGHEFSKPFKSLPPKFILKSVTSLIQKVSPGVKVDLTSSQPSALATLAGTSQSMNVTAPNCDPPPLITQRDIPEDCTILFQRNEKTSEVAKKYSEIIKGNSYKRKQIFSNPKKAREFTFDTENTYTFDFYMNYLDLMTYCLDLGILQYDISGCLNGQPIQSLAKTVDGRYLWSFQVWNAKLVSHK